MAKYGKAVRFCAAMQMMPYSNDRGMRWEETTSDGDKIRHWNLWPTRDAKCPDAHMTFWYDEDGLAHCIYWRGSTWFRIHLKDGLTRPIELTGTPDLFVCEALARSA